MRKAILMLVGASLLAGGCSTRPRNFDPVLAMPTADEAGYQRDLADCRAMVAAGKRSGFGPAVAATGAGVAAGYGAGAATVASGAVGIGMAPAAALAAVAIMPLAAIGAGFGVTRAIRSSREKKVKRAMGECLAAHGHGVAAWKVVKNSRSHRAEPGVQASGPLPPSSAPQTPASTAGAGDPG